MRQAKEAAAAAAADDVNFLLLPESCKVFVRVWKSYTLNEKKKQNKKQQTNIQKTENWNWNLNSKSFSCDSVCVSAFLYNNNK